MNPRSFSLFPFPGEGSERYWEFNLSPAGHWNVYRFASYRKEMREEPAFASLPFRVRTEPEALRLSRLSPKGRFRLEPPRGVNVSPVSNRVGIAYLSLTNP